MEEHDIAKGQALAALMKAHSARGDVIVQLQGQNKALKEEIDRLHGVIGMYRKSARERAVSREAVFINDTF